MMRPEEFERLYLGGFVSDKPMTQDEANALEDGAKVIVTWGGGNGPHYYTVHVSPDGRRFAGPLRYGNPLEFVGPEKYRTHVWRAPETRE